MNLPLPSISAQQLSVQLTEFLCRCIDRQGPLSFAEYMHFVLYHPKFGYYNNPLEKIGVAGDFITAPEISPLFAQCLSKQIEAILSVLPRSSILEVGAGSGQLAADILLALQATLQLPEYYYILEVSEELKNRQQAKLKVVLPQYYDRIIWLADLPAGFSGVVIANEVLDAMPVHRFCVEEDQFLEQMVDCSQGQLQEKWMPANEQIIQKLLNTGISFACGYHSEISLLIPAWLASLAECVTTGIVLLIDYGLTRAAYYHPERHMGTLMCHYQHYAHGNPYFWPGLQDLTAYVDFTAVAEATMAHGFTLAGYTTQSHFLLNCGLLELAAEHQNTAEETWLTSQAIKKLILPSEMGELFKVMALSKKIAMPLIGFQANDQSYKL